MTDLGLTDHFQYVYNPTENIFAQTATKINYPNINSILPGDYVQVQLQADYEFYPIHNKFAFKYLKNTIEESKSIPILVNRKIEAFNNTETQLFFPEASIPFSLITLELSLLYLIRMRFSINSNFGGLKSGVYGNQTTFLNFTIWILVRIPSWLGLK